ncbi:SRPBCC family protein [Jatrophihabitans fulvus]
MRHADRPTVEVALEVAAPPEAVWPLISDIGLPVDASDELVAVRWSDGDGPAALGRTFVGSNRNDVFGEWETSATVVVCDPPREFGWDVGDLDEPNSRWRFRVEPTATGCTVAQWAQLGYGPSGMHIAITRYPEKEEAIVASRLKQWRRAMERTLATVKDRAESGR